MAKKQAVQAPKPGTLVALPGGRVAEWVSQAEVGTRFRTEHFRTIDTLGLLLRNGAITPATHDAGQKVNRSFVFAQVEPAGAPPLDRIPGCHWQDTMTERCAFARKRLGQALDAVRWNRQPGGVARFGRWRALDVAFASGPRSRAGTGARSTSTRLKAS